jgi:hypothetical protein
MGFLKQQSIILIPSFFCKLNSTDRKTTYTSPPAFLIKRKPFVSGAVILAVLNLYPRGFSVS